jgi:hypothetical protein
VVADGAKASNRPPAGSLPIDETEWSGDHHEIKRAINVRARDNVSIDPEGNVWAENTDGTWTDHGPATDYTRSGKAKGRRGKDRRDKRRKK